MVLHPGRRTLVHRGSDQQRRARPGLGPPASLCGAPAGRGLPAARRGRRRHRAGGRRGVRPAVLHRRAKPILDAGRPGAALRPAARARPRPPGAGRDGGCCPLHRRRLAGASATGQNRRGDSPDRRDHPHAGLGPGARRRARRPAHGARHIRFVGDRGGAGWAPVRWVCHPRPTPGLVPPGPVYAPGADHAFYVGHHRAYDALRDTMRAQEQALGQAGAPETRPATRSQTARTA